MNYFNRSDFKITPCAFAVACFFNTGVALAESAPQLLSHEPLADCGMSPEGMHHCQLTPIVVTAAAESTQAYLVKANPKQPIQPVPASDGADYLKHIAGFNAIRNGGTNGDPVFRGMFGSRLKILTNGSEMLGACPARMDAPTSYISPQNFDEITVIKGPQSVLFGAASAATVNFVRQPTRFEQDSVKAQGTVMAASNQRIDTDIDTTVGNALGSIRLTANTSEANDYKDGNGDKVPAKWRKWNADLNATYTPSDDTWIEFSAGRGDGEARYAGRGMDGSQFLRESAGLRFEHKYLSSVLEKLEGQLNYNNADHIMDNYSLREPTAMHMGGHGHGSSPMSGMGGTIDHTMGSGMGMGNMSMNDPTMAMQLARKTISGRLAATLSWLDYELVTGVDANHNEHKGRMGSQSTFKNMAWVQDAEFKQLGAFAELTKSLGDTRKLATGLRIDQHNVQYLKHDDATQAYPTPFGSTRRETLPSGFIRLENNWPAHNINGYVGVGHVSRMPDYWELFSPVHSGNSSAFLAVQPEKTTQLDVGLSHASGAWSNWVSAYAGKVNDFILISYHHHAGHDGASAGAKNIDATIAGVEAGTSYQFNENFSATSNVAYAWGRNDTDNGNNALPQITPLEARIGLNYQQDQFSLGTLVRMVAKQHRIALNQGNIVGYDLAKSKGFATVAVNVAYQINPTLNASMGVDNLFDKAYSEHLNKAGNSAFGYASTEQINEMGRNFWAKLSFTY